MSSNAQPLLRLVNQFARCLSLALLPALTSEAIAGDSPAHRNAQRQTVAARPRLSVPYLALIGSPGLRLETTRLPLTPEPTPPEPPKPPAPVVEEKPKQEPRPEPRIVEEPPAEPAPAPKADAEPQPPAPTGKRPVSILPDDTVRELNPDEVLPFFRYPSSASSVPTPETMPRSSATYQIK